MIKSTITNFAFELK